MVSRDRDRGLLATYPGEKMMEITTVMIISIVSGFLGWLNLQLQKVDQRIHTIDRKVDKIDGKMSFLISEVTRRRDAEVRK